MHGIAIFFGGIMEYQLMAIDMDGTLLNSELHISKENENKIQEAIAQNKVIVIATGRSLSEMNPYMHQLKAVRYFILESGAEIYDAYHTKMIYQAAFLKEEVKQIVQISHQQDLMSHYFVDGYSYSFIEKMKHMDKYHMGKLQQFYLDHVHSIHDENEFIENNKEKIEKVIFYHQSLDDVKQCYQNLKDVDVEKPQVGVSIELSPKGVTKAFALEKLCHVLNIEMNQAIAIGDSDNDKEVLSIVGLSIAMENANHNIKEISDCITLDNDHHGVAKAIKDHLLG